MAYLCGKYSCILKHAPFGRAVRNFAAISERHISLVVGDVVSIPL
jgi:hypothetical protein